MTIWDCAFFANFAGIPWPKKVMTVTVLLSWIGAIVVIITESILLLNVWKNVFFLSIFPLTFMYLITQCNFHWHY